MTGRRGGAAQQSHEVASVDADFVRFLAHSIRSPVSLGGAVYTTQPCVMT